MAAIVFDADAYINKLSAVGFTEEQAAVQAETIAALINEQLVTKDYLDRCLAELEYKLVIKLGSMMAVSIALVAALVRLV
jgi:hypothetical protein